MADYSELVNRYKRFREINRKLQNMLFKQVSGTALDECGRKLGITEGDTFVFGNEDEMYILMDYCIYEYLEKGQNAASRYLAESPPASDTDEYAVLKAMSQSFYTLIKVAKVLPGVGVEAEDLFSDRTYPLIDMGMGSTAVEGLVLATRLLSFTDFVMTSGAALPVDPETLAEILNSVLPRFGREAGKYIEIDARRKADLDAAVIRTCLKNDMSQHIKYQDADAEPVTAPLRAGPRVGRNEPCPCGSGKKYKRCCGR